MSDLLTPSTDTTRPHTSVSACSSYEQCPQRYWYQKIDKVPPEHVSDFLVFGRGGHQVVAEIYMRYRALEEMMSKEEAKDLAARAWSNEAQRAMDSSEDGIRYTYKNDYNSSKDQLVDCIGAFVDWWDPPSEILGVETRFRTEITDPKTGEIRKRVLMGYTDAITRRNGDLIIDEHKTSRSRYNESRLLRDFQASIYIGALNASRLRFQVLLKQKTPTVEGYYVTRSEKQIEEAVNKMCRILDAIDAGIVYKKRDTQCSSCQFRNYCEDH